jgi:hypothetical protein
VWHKKDREAGKVPHTSTGTKAGWTKSGWYGWVYGWKLHLAIAACGIWIPLCARLTPANTVDNEVALHLIEELPEEARFVLGDIHYNAPNVHEACQSTGRFLVTTKRGAYPTPMLASKSDASSISYAAWPTRTSTSFSRPSSKCTGRFPPED